jgi:hypothetical protein
MHMHMHMHMHGGSRRSTGQRVGNICIYLKLGWLAQISSCDFELVQYIRGTATINMVI